MRGGTRLLVAAGLVAALTAGGSSAFAAPAGPEAGCGSTVSAPAPSGTPTSRVIVSSAPRATVGTAPATPGGAVQCASGQVQRSFTSLDGGLATVPTAGLAGLEADPPKGLILRSAKRSGFLVGADIAQFRGVSGAAAMAAGLAKLGV